MLASIRRVAWAAWPTTPDGESSHTFDTPAGKMQCVTALFDYFTVTSDRTAVAKQSLPTMRMEKVKLQALINNKSKRQTYELFNVFSWLN